MYKNEDTTKSQRTPKNLLSFLFEYSLAEGFLLQLAKHHTRLKELLDKEAIAPELTDARFIIELNNFKNDLLTVSDLCSQIDRISRAHQDNIEKSRKHLESHSAEDLIRKASNFYHNARRYDKHFEFHSIFRKGNRAFYRFYFVLNPFKYNEDFTNEENLFNLVTSFKMHDDFFKNFINTLYSDRNDGAEFLGKTFQEIAAEYKVLRVVIAEVEQAFPKSTQDSLIKKLDEKFEYLEDILAKYPATVHSATKVLLSYIDDSVKA